MKYSHNYKDDKKKLFPKSKYSYLSYTNVYSFLLLLFSVISTISFVYLTIILSSIYSKINIEALELLNVTQIHDMYKVVMLLTENNLIECLSNKCSSGNNNFEPL